ncbi:MAG TPA: class I SAM-dependent methyltransferase [Pyrinomonadaceae bacterium]|nr:class I SAM-dependent methyltransferase [Pyrinomonadaceae bacterium]
MDDVDGKSAAVGARPCPACEADAPVYRGLKSGFDVISCTRCRTLYTAHLPAEEAAEDYDSYYCEQNLSVPAFINERLDQIVAQFAPYRRNGRLLDVGFGAGTLLEAARRGGWEARGVEVSQSAIEHVRKAGFDVFCGTLAEAQYPDDYFDVVTASEVLEHVPHPQPVLNEIARVLRPGGLLWATTPHGRGMSAHLLKLKWSAVSPPEHLQLFSIDGIKKMSAQAGFRRVRVATEGVNPYELIQGLRGGATAAAVPPATGEQSNARVESSYQLNEALMASPSRRLLKSALNNLLNLGRIGDSLKIWAEK